MKKKIIVFLGLFLLLITGCNNTMATPTEKVEDFLGKYQSMDSEVLAQLDSVISDEATMSDEQKKEYRALMEKQYQNLAYKIKDEKIKGDTATVDVEIEVFDYATSITESRKYYTEHKDEINNAKATMNTDNNNNNTNNNVRNNDNNTNNNARNDNNTNNNNNNVIDNDSNNDADNRNDATDNNNNIDPRNDKNDNDDSKYLEYKIKELKKVTDKVKYDITFNLTKVGNEWKIEDISDIDRQKIHGLFEG